MLFPERNWVDLRFTFFTDLGTKQLDRSCILRCWNSDFDFLSQKRWFEIALENDFELELLFAVFFNKRNNSEWQVDLLD